MTTELMSLGENTTITMRRTTLGGTVPFFVQTFTTAEELRNIVGTHSVLYYHTYYS